MNKVSVIIPCYNKAPYVKEAIESVINQTFSDIEIIVVNDASTDNSAEIIKELKEKYFAEYCKTQSQTKYLMYTYYERNTDAEAKELQKIGLLDKYRNYTFWDNFPDNWKLSDEELAALDYENDDYEHNDYEYTN